MASDGKFAHISVSSDDEDDFVIHAGVRAGQSSASARPAPDPASERAGGRSGANEEPCAKGPEPEASQLREPDGCPAGKEPAASRVQKDGYRETTLEDLEGGSMSSLQKGVIIAAIVGILAFVLWYVVLR